MIKIFQRFDLDLEEGLDAIFKAKENAGETLARELRSQGFDVLQAASDYNGAPESIIIGTEKTSKNPKQAFQELALKLGLPYKSGDVYFQRE